jgi:hypothetical protein
LQEHLYPAQDIDSERTSAKTHLRWVHAKELHLLSKLSAVIPKPQMVDVNFSFLIEHLKL